MGSAQGFFLNMQPLAIMIHVPEVDAGIAWYTKAFPQAKKVLLPGSGIDALKIGNFLIEVVESDEKVSSGKSGTVLYWQVDNLLVAMGHFQGLGSHIHRGPLKIEQGMGMCQLTDTFGNLIGLRGVFTP